MAKETIRSINELATLLGKSGPAVQKWLKHPTWSFGRGPWAAADLPKISAWAAEHLQADRNAEGAAGTTGDAGGKITQARLQKLIREIKHLDLKIGVESGEMHRVDECEQAQIARIELAKQALCSVAPSTIAAAILRKWPAIRSIVDELALAEVAREGNEQAIRQHLKKPE